MRRFILIRATLNNSIQTFCVINVSLGLKFHGYLHLYTSRGIIAFLGDNYTLYIQGCISRPLRGDDYLIVSSALRGLTKDTIERPILGFGVVLRLLLPVRRVRATSVTFHTATIRFSDSVISGLTTIRDGSCNLRVTILLRFCFRFYTVLHSIILILRSSSIDPYSTHGLCKRVLFNLRQVFDRYVKT